MTDTTKENNVDPYYMHIIKQTDGSFVFEGWAWFPSCGWKVGKATTKTLAAALEAMQEFCEYAR